MLLSPWFTEPSDLVAQVAAGPAAAVRTGRALLRAAEQIPALVGRAQTIIGIVELLVVRIDRISADAAVAAKNVDRTCTGAAAAVGGAAEIEKRVNALIDRCEPLLDAVIAIDPITVGHLQSIIEELQPLLAELHDAVPDVRGILPVVRRLEPVMVDVETRVAGLPGAVRLRRRGERVIEKAESDGA